MISFDHYTAFDLKIGLSPELWARKRPSHMVVVFPHPDPISYIHSLNDSEIFQGGASCTCTVNGVHQSVVSLLFNGLLVPEREYWAITHPASSILIPVTQDSDIYIPRKRVSPHLTLGCLQRLFLQDPPSALIHV